MSLTRCQQEQRECAAHLAMNPGCECAECRGARLGIADWMAEEILLMADDEAES